ncbi:putative protein N(5)-glutamine methyltransferase [Gordonia sp. SL306]|uniref:putative protein N(5)-glutamine methyltransferase n=1 Tax=Gordonia sp. SL306 TaxID=2995145 RepID=UPI002271FFE9|nr:putative protein N(5)-glutamine methyltransferase [Gordonia sp. SL306]WAC55938.1 putative protein N(5)-glutamine methyltransferase [Gordonia sp. SL306]
MSVETLSHTVSRLRDAGCVFAEEEAELLIGDAGDAAELEELLVRRVAGEPLEVVLGWMTFRGLRIEVDSGVFVPRQRTAFLVRQALAVTQPGSIVVDLCCGTGAIGFAIATELPGIELHACDIDPVAVRCASRNLSTVGGATWCGDLFEPLPDRLRGAVDVVVVNAPYVPTAEIAMMPPEARDHEPRHTLDGGGDGVDVHRRVARSVGQWLRPGGHVLIETGDVQSRLTAEALAEAGLGTTVASSEQMWATVVVGQA